MAARINRTQRLHIRRLYILSGYTVKQISEAMKIDPITVRRHLYRGLIKLDRKRGYQGPLMADGSYGKVGQ